MTCARSAGRVWLGLSGGDVPRVEGEGDEGVRGVSDEATRVGEVGWAGQ